MFVLNGSSVDPGDVLSRNGGLLSMSDMSEEKSKMIWQENDEPVHSEKISYQPQLVSHRFRFLYHQQKSMWPRGFPDGPPPWSIFEGIHQQLGWKVLWPKFVRSCPEKSISWTPSWLKRDLKKTVNFSRVEHEFCWDRLKMICYCPFTTAERVNFVLMGMEHLLRIQWNFLDFCPPVLCRSDMTTPCQLDCLELDFSGLEGLKKSF